MRVPSKVLPVPWLLLVFSLPRTRGSLRVSAWRKLQRFGALPFGNSGYLIPNGPETRERFEWLATLIRSERGEASVVEVQSIDNHSVPQLERKFNDARSRDYKLLLKELRRGATASSVGRKATRIRQRLQEIASIDFFGSPLRDQVERALKALEKPQTQQSHLELEKVSRAAYGRMELLDAGAFVRTHLAQFAKRRERAYYSHRAFTTCAVSSWEVKSSTSAFTRSF